MPDRDGAMTMGEVIDAWNKDKQRIAELEAELRSIRAGHTVTTEFNLSPVMKVFIKLIEMGWTPPALEDDDE